MVQSDSMHDFSPFYTPFSSPAMLGFMSAIFPLLLVAALWTIVLKGYALWHAARNSQKEWFIALLVINTLGILEIIYLVWFRPQAVAKESKPVHDSSVRS